MKKQLLILVICASFTIGAIAQTVVPITNGDFSFPKDGLKHYFISELPGWYSDSTANNDAGREASGTAYFNAQRTGIYTVVGDTVDTIAMQYMVYFKGVLTYTGGPKDTTFITAYLCTFSGTDRTSKVIRDSINFIFSKSNNPGWVNLSGVLQLPAAAPYAGDSIILEIAAKYPLENSNTWIGIDDVMMKKSPDGMFPLASIVKKASTPIVIDGTIDTTWASATQYDILRPFKGDTFANAADLSGYWKALSSDSGLFVLVNTTDDNIRYASGSFGQGYEKDGFEVYFDMNVDSLQDGGGPGGAPWDGHNGTGHFQIGVTNLVTPSLPGWCTGCKMSVNAGDTTSGVNYPIIAELYVPWKALPNKQSKHANLNGTLPIGFDVYLIDNDGPASGEPARRRLTWSNYGTVNESYNNMDNSGTMLLPKVVFVSSITVASAGNATTITDIGGTLQMSATVLPTDAYIKTVKWSASPDTVATIDAAGLLTAVGNGNVIVTATANDGFGIKGTKTISVVHNTKIGTSSIAAFKLGPNPVKDYINISSQDMIKTVSIINITGQKLSYINVNGSSTTIKLDNLQSGVYFVRVQTLSGVAVKRIVKQ